MTDYMESQADGLSLIMDALAFAALKHRDQRRKGRESSPYINHPIALAQVLVNEAGVSDPVTIAAAILHDTVEDTRTDEEELAERFGEVVARIVMEVTDDKDLPKPARKQAQIDHAPSLSERAQLVKLADKICNVRDLVDAPPRGWNAKRVAEYRNWAARVVRGIQGSHETLEKLFEQALRNVDEQ